MQEISVAGGLYLLLLIGPLFRIPPFDQLLEAFCRRIVDFQRWAGEGPVTVDCEEARAALSAAGVVVEGLTQRIIDALNSGG